MIAATCATIGAILASASGGAVISLSGDCPAIAIPQVYSPPITIKADGATIRGLNISGGGVIWQGGTFHAPKGPDGIAASGYAAQVRAKHVTLENATFTDARKGLVVAQAEDVTIRDSHFVRLREDGIIASSTKGLEITRNDFRDSDPLLNTCTTGETVERGVPRRVCEAGGGMWIDGSHPDAIQLRNGIIGALIGWNRIEGTMQGIGQMDSPKDAPLADVKIIGNHVRGSFPHSITLGACDGCSIIDNDVARIRNGKTLVRYIEGRTTACGNKVADGGRGRERCPK